MAKNMAQLMGDTVTNMLWCSDYEPETDTLIDPGDRPVGIGDTYDGENFYRNGVRILTPLEEAQTKIELLEAEKKTMAAAYAEGGGKRMITYDIMYRAGQRDARELRAAAHAMTGTEIIAREYCAPPFDPEKDYTDWPVGGPVADEGQVWTLIQPHNAAHFPGLRPSGNRANWGLTHTTDPAKAKPWVDSFGTSGLYLKDECYLDKQGKVYRCLVDQTNFDAEAMPEYWEEVIL